MNKQILILALVLLSITFISAQQTFQQNMPVDLKIQCIINGTYCSNLATCNVSIQYPNASLLLNNKQMTNQISFYNYTLPSTSVLGEYSCSATCCDSGLCGTNDCNYILTPTGDSNNLGFYIMLTIVIVGILLFGVFTKNIPITLIGGMISMAWGVYIAINGFDIFKNFGTQILSVGIIALGAVWIGIAGLEYFDVI